MVRDVEMMTNEASECLAVLQGHTSLVGQLQMRGGTLVTGGSDGSVRVWSLERFCPIHRLAAHDNSVTSLQFDDTRVVSGGSDGRVKVWDLKTGHLVRELVTQGDAVWRVAFEEEKCVAMALKNGRTVMEVSAGGAAGCLVLSTNAIFQVWNFSPPDDLDSPSDRPLSLPQQHRSSDLTVPARPLSALSMDYRSTAAMQDVDMMDAGPSTAPLQHNSFFRDDLSSDRAS